MQSPAERHNHILQALKRQGYVTVTELSNELDVSEATVRRDLRSLEERHLLFRTHGGASPSNHQVYDRPVSEKSKQHTEEKQRIGKAAAGLVDPHDSLILGSGTTMIQLARHLKSGQALTIITNAMNVAMELVHAPQVEVFMLGGVLRLTSTSVVGPTAEDMMRGYACRKLFLGVDGFDVAHGLTTSNAMEAHLNQIMLEAAQQTIVVTDSSKFGLRGFSRICGVDAIDRVVTDDHVPEAVVRQLEEQNIGVVIA